MADDVPVVFHAPGCPYSTKLRLQLRPARVPYRSVRFRDDEDGATAVRAQHPQGWELAPTVVVGDRYPFNPRRPGCGRRWPGAEGRRAPSAPV